MAVPGYQDLMLPLLIFCADSKEHGVKDAMAHLAKVFAISEADRAIMLPSGTQTQFYNRVTWATTYLVRSMLLTKTGRGRYCISARGVDVLAKKPKRIDDNFLKQFSEYVTFKSKKTPIASGEEVKLSEEPDEPKATPIERFDAADKELREALVDEIRERLSAATPKGFERLVVKLLVAMNYGGGRLDYAEVTGKSGDDGIDGVIRQDQLGLDMVYVQAKKWENKVPPGEIDRFIGSLQRKRANKGVFITSGAFTDGATRASKEASVRIRLIDGDELAEMMIDLNVGVATEKTYAIKKIDSDFFEELDL